MRDVNHIRPNKTKKFQGQLSSMQMEEPSRGFPWMWEVSRPRLNVVCCLPSIRNESRRREEMGRSQPWTRWWPAIPTPILLVETKFTGLMNLQCSWKSQFGAPLGSCIKFLKLEYLWSLANERLLANRLVELSWWWLHSQQIEGRPCLNLAMGVEWSHLRMILQNHDCFSSQVLCDKYFILPVWKLSSGLVDLLLIGRNLNTDAWLFVTLTRLDPCPLLN